MRRHFDGHPEPFGLGSGIVVVVTSADRTRPEWIGSNGPTRWGTGPGVKVGNRCDAIVGGRTRGRTAASVSRRRPERSSVSPLGSGRTAFTVRVVLRRGPNGVPSRRRCPGAHSSVGGDCGAMADRPGGYDVRVTGASKSYGRTAALDGLHMRVPSRSM